MIKQMNNKWDKILNDLSEEEFDLDFFQETMKESFDIIYKQVKEQTLDVETAFLLVKMARFSEREIFCKEQDAAQYLVSEILYQMEGGFVDEEIANGELKMYAPNSYKKVSIDIKTFDISSLIS